MSLLVCPNCQVEMKIIKKENVDIDVCTNCQGIWLDKGELEKIIAIAENHLDDELKNHSDKIKRNRFWVSFFDVFK